MSVPILICEGDGIGPEIMRLTLRVLEAAKAPLSYKFVELGEKVYNRGISSGIPEDFWDLIKKHKVLLKGPVATPLGAGFKSVNVTIRKGLGLFANVRPCVSYHPFVKTSYPGVDCVIIRENEEDLYAGIEYQQSSEVFHAIKIISKPGTERIIRYAFEYAKANNRQKITCLTKNNILKLTDGYFYQRFLEVAKEYPDIQTEHLIIDIGAAKLATQPQNFDVVVTLNLYGDIVSDIVAEVSGSVGLAASANIGEVASMFEAIHGTAPDIAGQGIANPSGLILASVLMLQHLGLVEHAELIYNAWAATIEAGIHTRDIAISKSVSSQEFTDAVISNLGNQPKTLKKASFKAKLDLNKALAKNYQFEEKNFEGVDVFIEFRGPVEQLAEKLILSQQNFSLKLISNRGLLIWPQKTSDIDPVDQFRCRFVGKNQDDVPNLLTSLQRLGVQILKVEYLFSFNARRAYSLAQGE